MNTNAVYKYMVVENVIDVCEGIERRMKSFTTWQSVGYSTGIKDAIEKISNKKPQLIFLDWSLNGGSAFEILQHIQNMPAYNPYIIFNTGFQADHPEIPQEIINNYAVDKYLVKPLWENLRNNLATYLKEAAEKATKKNIKNKSVWIEELTGTKLPMDLNNLVCICQHPLLQRSRDMYLVNTSGPITTTLKWQDCVDLLSKNELDFFITKHRSHLVIKNHIEKYEKPFVRLRNTPFKIEVVKDNFAAFENWLFQNKAQG